MTTYSSIATHMWPPPSSDTASRLQRLQELENMRKQRQLQSAMTASNESTDAGTRLSRRQQISGSIGLHRLTANHEEKRKSFLGRRALAEGRASTTSESYGSLPNNSEYGGARPKNFDILSLRRNVSSNDNSMNRERSSSLTSSNEDISTPLLRSKSVTGLLTGQSEQLEQPANEYANESYSVGQKSDSVANTSISEDEEDIESFKRSLFGKQSLMNVPEKEELMLTPGLPVFTDPITTTYREIDTSKLVIHHEGPKVEKQYFKSFSDFSGQQRLNNMVSESMKRLDSLFDQPTTKYESVTKSPRISRSDRLETRSHTISVVPETVHERGLRRDNLVLNIGSRSNCISESLQGTEKMYSDAISQQCNENKVELHKNSECVEYPRSNEQIDTKQEESKGVNVNAVKKIISESQVTEKDLGRDCNLTLENEKTSVKGPEQSVENHTFDLGIEISEKHCLKSEQVETETLAELSNDPSHPVLIKKQDEEDLVDASNVAFFEMSSNYNNQYIQNSRNNIADDSTDFSHFMKTNNFLNYDNANREMSDENRMTSYGVSADRFLSSEDRTTDYKSRLRTSSYARQTSDTVKSMLFGSSDESSSVRYRTLPYSLPEPSEYSSYTKPTEYSSYTSNLNTRKSSTGTIGVSRDAFSRIDDLFDQPKKENPLLNNIQTSSLPRRRARDSLVGSRPTITRSRSDASDSGFDIKRTLLGRSLRNHQTNDQEEVEDRQPLFKSSLADYQNKSEETLTSITTRFGSLRNRLGISSGRRQKEAFENTELSNNTYNYTRSQSMDHGNENNLSRNELQMTGSYDFTSGFPSHNNDLLRSHSQTTQSYEFFSGNLSGLGNRGISAEVSELNDEISYEFFNREVSENIDSNKTITPDTDNDMISPNQDGHHSTEEPLPVQDEIEMSETILDEEVNYSSSCEVEVGQMLIFTDQNIDKHNSEEIVKDNEIHVAKLDDENSRDTTFNRSGVDSNKVALEKNACTLDITATNKISSDENDNRSSASSNSSKKKKNKKKGKKSNMPELSKVLVSHPSEVLKKNKKALSKESLNNSKDDTPSSKTGSSDGKKDAKSPKKARDLAENSSKKLLKEKSKGKEQTSPSKHNSSKSDTASDSSKSKSKVKNLFDTLIHALDRKSDTSSSVNLSVEDKSQSSGEKTPIADEWEIIPDPSSASSDSKLVDEDNYATFENEDIIPVTKRKSLDDNGGISTDYYETASDHTISGASEYEEFYEALPTELLGDYWNENDIHTETERKEHFVYVCASSKVKRKRIQSEDNKNMENINNWIDNNLFPGKKFPEHGEKVANKKFAESSVMSKNDMPQTDLQSISFESKDIISSNVQVVEKEVNLDLPEFNNISKEDKDKCENTKQQQTKVNTSEEIVTQNVKEEKVGNLRHELCNQIEAKFNGQEQSCRNSEIGLDHAKVVEKEHLDLNASDRSFTDKLVSALQEKLCSACQGILVDVLKKTYFERYEEIARVNLKNESSSVESLVGKEKCSGSDDSTLKTNGYDTKKAQKPKRLEVEDLLYGSSKPSRTNQTINGGYHQDISKTNMEGLTNTEVQQNMKIPLSPQKSRKEKPVITAKNDNFIGSPNGRMSPPRSSEVKIKGKIVNLDKSKKERVVSPKPEHRLCRRKSLEAQKESTKSDNEDDYKLPNLRNNPFIRSDKMRASKGKTDSNIKAAVSKSPGPNRSMSFQCGEKCKSPSHQKSVERRESMKNSRSPSRQKSVERHASRKDSKSPSCQKSVERCESIKGPDKTTHDVNRNDSSINLVQNGKSSKIVNSVSKISIDKNINNGKKTPPMSPKRPSIFEQLSLAKTACENIGINSDIEKNSDQDSESKTLKAPPRKKKLSSPFRDTDVTNDFDLSPEEAKGVQVNGDDEVAPHRINLINWDPTKLLSVLYTVQLNKDTAEDVSHQFVNMEGLMEKLPMNKKKATLLKTWKRRFFRAKDGWLHYYETSNRDKPSDSVQLMGGKIEDLGNRVLGVDDGRGRFLMVRCPTDKEYGQWKMALESQTVNNIKATYVRPALSSPPHPEKKVLIIDIGSGGIRAGIMGAQPCLPQMFFPSMVASNKSTQELVIGVEAFKPEVRKNSNLIKIVEPSNKVDKFAIDMELISAVFDHIFKGLKVDPSKYWVMLSTPYKLGDTAMTNLMQMLSDTYHTKGVCMVMQSLLALYSYNATSGIIVDIGERMEILPIFDGVLIEGGVSRQAYGGQKVGDSLNSSLVELKYKFYNPVDKLLVRYVMEQSCYVSDNYKDLKIKCEKDSENFQTTVYLNNFDLPDDAHMSVSHDLSCFKSPEGFFNTDLWGMDYPCVHKLVYSAIQSCPMDNRKHMYRAIYLSGGVTMLPGFAERLEGELKKLAPPGVVVEVHASPQRYHSAFIGAGTLLSNVPINEQVFISAEEWKKDGSKAFRKWKGPS